MADLVIIVPSRGRPGSAGPLIEAFRATCTADTHLVFAVDDNDPAIDEYSAAVRYVPGGLDASMCVVDQPSTMVRALNGTVKVLSEVYSPAPYAFGFMGDDHCPRSCGWDTAYLDALRELGSGMVYGNDLLQGERIPTQVAITADIVRALGWMAPPVLTHLYVDNFWRDLGQHAGCLRYLPDVIVEHRHPVAGKANWDEGYARVNDTDMYARDERAYVDFVASGAFDEAVAKVKALRPAVTHG